MTVRLDLVARHRPPGPAGVDIVAVRWAFGAGMPFPEGGFTLQRFVGGIVQALVSGHKLPGAIPVAATGEWEIDPNTLEADRLNRAAVASGAPLPDAAAATMLLPVLAFALARPSPAILGAQLEGVAKLFGESHLNDLGLDHDHWHGSPPADYPALLALAYGTTDERYAYRAVTKHYQARALTYLAFRASDFGMAKFLGLGIEDVIPPSTVDPIDYRVEAYWHGPEDARARAGAPDVEWPEPPKRPEIVQAATVIGYPPYARFYGTGATWKPVRPASDVALSASPDTLFGQLVEAASRGPRSFAAPLARLSWQTRTPDNSDGPPPLVSREAYFWRIERHAFGAQTAVDDLEPPVDASHAFSICHDGEQVVRTVGKLFEDDIDLPYGDPPLEGWFAYRVAGIDLFGIAGPPSDPGMVRLRDSYPPPPPRVSIGVERLDLPAGGSPTLAISLDWEAPSEYAAPDAAEFRVRQIWTPVEHVPLAVAEVFPIAGALNAVQVDVEIADADGRPLADALLAQFVGGTLLTCDGEFSILSWGASLRLRVRRSAGRPPPLGGAAVRFAGPAVEDAYVHRLARAVAVIGAVQVVSVTPPLFDLLDAGGTPIKPATGKVHFHLLGQSYAVVPTVDCAHFEIVAPDPVERRAVTLLEALDQLPAGEAAVFLDGSPALFLPLHERVIPLHPPAGFAAGTLRISASTADSAAYVSGPVGPGNEGIRAEAMVPAFGYAVPAPGPEWIPRVWAEDSAQFAEQARATIPWQAMDVAVRYDIERAFESALGCSPRSSDESLISAGKGPMGEAGFERVSSSVFFPPFEDLLPGRAPTRTLYRVRGVSAAGVAGEWQIVALVRVPDVRIAPRPSLIKAVPDPAEDRVITCVWTQPGPLEGIGFELQARDIVTDTHPDEGWSTIADLLPGALASDAAGRFETQVADRPPGRWQEVRIVPVRHALDPDDPRAVRLRRIEGRPSNLMRARANGTLRAPEGLRAIVSSTGWVSLSWRNGDTYDEIELRRRAPGRSGYERRRISGDAEHFREPAALPLQGSWTYELVGIASGRRAISKPAALTWAAP